jgi:hypothetical protein
MFAYRKAVKGKNLRGFGAWNAAKPPEYGRNFFRELQARRLACAF